MSTPVRTASAYSFSASCRKPAKATAGKGRTASWAWRNACSASATQGGRPFRLQAVHGRMALPDARMVRRQAARPASRAPLTASNLALMGAPR